MVTIVLLGSIYADAHPAVMDRRAMNQAELRGDTTTFPPIVYAGWPKRQVPAMWKEQQADDAEAATEDVQGESRDTDGGDGNGMRGGGATKGKKSSMPGQMKSLFVSPVYIVNLFDEGGVQASFSENLATYAISKYEAFLTSEKALNPVRTVKVHTSPPILADHTRRC